MPAVRPLQRHSGRDIQVADRSHRFCPFVQNAGLEQGRVPDKRSPPCFRQDISSGPCLGSDMGVNLILLVGGAPFRSGRYIIPPLAVDQGPRVKLILRAELQWLPLMEYMRAHQDRGTVDRHAHQPEFKDRQRGVPTYHGTSSSRTQPAPRMFPWGNSPWRQPRSYRGGCPLVLLKLGRTVIWNRRPSLPFASPPIRPREYGSR